MCKLIVGLKKPGDNPAVSGLLEANSHTLYSQPDGMGSLTFSKEGKLQTFKHLTNYDLVMDKTIDKLKDSILFGIHSRIATTGSVKEDNIHFFRKGNAFMAHNGIVNDFSSTIYRHGRHNNSYTPVPEYNPGFHEGGYPEDEILDGRMEQDIKTMEKIETKLLMCTKGCSTYTMNWCKKHKNAGIKYLRLFNVYGYPTDTPALPGKVIDIAEPKEEDEDKTDSLLFLENLGDDITIEKIQEQIKERSFTGVATILDTDKKNLFIFGTREIPIHTDYKTYVLFYSFDPECTVNRFTDLFSIRFLIEETEIETQESKFDEGIYRFSLSKSGDIKLEEKRPIEEEKKTWPEKPTAFHGK